MEKLKNLFKNLFENKRLMAYIGGGVVAVILIIVLICTLVSCNGPNSDGTENTGGSVESSGIVESSGVEETTSPMESTADPIESTAEPTEAPTESVPVETVPDESEPEETTPAETQPAETTPVETDPVETKPAETEPVETEPQETEPEVKWTEVNETVYATSTVNVRKGPSADTKKLGSLSKGDSVKRTAIGDNGWSRVEYDGKEAYISSEYLSTKKPADNSTVSYDGLELAKFAIEHLGLEYVYGGNSLKTGCDCSGFTKLIYAKFGIELPRTAAEQSKLGKVVSQSEAKVGDLYAVKYDNNSNYTGHAGIYLGGGLIVSEMPGEGCVVTMLWGDEKLIQIGNNTYEGDDDWEQLINHYIDCGFPYSFQDEVIYYPETNVCEFGIIADLMGIGYRIDAIGDADKYPKLIAAWKDHYMDDEDACFEVKHSDNRKRGYLNGKWYNSSELSDMWETGIIEKYSPAMRFYGAPWDISSTILTGFDEKVDFSTFPG